jgi:hypothetical protein
MTLITRSVTTGSVGVSIMVPGFDPTKGPLVIAPSTTLDLFTVLTEDQLEAIQPALAQLVAAGDLTVAATVNPASFNPLGNVPVLTASRALASDVSGAIAVSTTTSAELVFVHGVTSAIQTQLNGKQATISSVLSSASLGGATSESLVVTGLLTTSTIIAVTQSVAGANNTAKTGYTNSSNGHLTVFWTADPGAGAKVVVSFI